MRSLGYLAFVLALAATAFGVHRLLTPPAPPPAAALGDGAIARFTCPMHPGVHASAPGVCPQCGMPLSSVPDSAKGLVFLDEKRRQAIGVRTVAAQRTTQHQQVRASATIVYDETRRSIIAPRFAGWVGSVFDHAVGSQVHRGDPLFSVYSPELVAAQTDYLGAFSSKPGSGADNTSADALIALSRTKLMRLGMPEDQLAAFEQHPQVIEQLIIRAPTDGTIIERAVLPGARIESGAPAMQLADLSTVWVEAAVAVQDLAMLREGQALEVRQADDAEMRCTAEIIALLPQVDPVTRAGRLRARAANPQGRLRPGMLAECSVDVPLGTLLTVPDGAVIYAGDKRIVFVAMGAGHYRPARVEIGRRGDGWIEIRSGLAEGDQVVSAGVFMLASESRLASGLEQW